MKKTCLSALFILLINLARSQGCSDAGACSIGGLKGGRNMDKSYLGLSMQLGEGEQDVRIYTPQLEVFFKLARRTGLRIKMPYMFASGNLGSTNGFGDITSVFNYTCYDTGKWKLGINAGVRIGVNDANKKHGSALNSLGFNYSLPMPYQTSLGTHDLLLGLDAVYNKKWLFGLAFQMPVYQFNNNGFDTATLRNSQTDARQYFTSAKLLRRPDIVLRIDRQFRYLGDRCIVQLGLVPIYHLGHDRFTDTSGVSHAISGSKGLTLNFAVGIQYHFKHFSLIAMAAKPLITRKVRPDGLTRHSVAGLELRYSF